MDYAKAQCLGTVLFTIGEKIMATRNPNNVIEFGKVNFGAPVTVYLITGAVGVNAQVGP